MVTDTLNYFITGFEFPHIPKTKSISLSVGPGNIYSAQYFQLAAYFFAKHVKNNIKSIMEYILSVLILHLRLFNSFFSDTQDVPVIVCN